MSVPKPAVNGDHCTVVLGLFDGDADAIVPALASGLSLCGQPGRWRDEDTINSTVEDQKIDVQTCMNGEQITSDFYSVK